MTFILCTLIAFIVVSVTAILHRKGQTYYYFAVFVVIAGAFLSLWAYNNGSTKAADYFQISTQIYAFEQLEGLETVGVQTAAGKFFISSSYLSIQEREKVLAMELTSNPATIWLESAEASSVKGLISDDLQIDRFHVAAIDNESHRRLANVGFVISGVGIFLFFLHYFFSGESRRF